MLTLLAQSDGIGVGTKTFSWTGFVARVNLRDPCGGLSRLDLSPPDAVRVRVGQASDDGEVVVAVLERAFESLKRIKRVSSFR